MTDSPHQMEVERFRFRDFFEERGKPSDFEDMSESREERPDASLMMITDQLAAMKMELTEFINEFRRVQMDLLEGVSSVGKCGSCGKGGTLGSPTTPTYTTSHKLILTCVDNHCGKTNPLTAVGEAWLYEIEEPIDGLEEEEQALVESICSAVDMEKDLQLKLDKIAELEDGLASLVDKITLPFQDNIKIVRKSPQVHSRVGSSDKGNKENTPPSKTAQKTPSKSPLKETRNPFKAQPVKPKILLQPARDGGGKKAEGPKKVEEGNDRGRRRVRSPSPDKARLMDRSTSSTRGARAVKKSRQLEEATWMPSRDDYEKLRKENEELKEGLQRLQLSINHLTSQLDDHKRRERLNREGKATAGDGNATAGDGNATVGGKKQSKRTTADAGATKSYSQAAAKPTQDQALEEKQRRNRRERDKALLLFTAPETPKVVTPKEWRVMYLKWNLTTKLRKKTEAKELHNLVLRMLEKVKLRKFIREVSLIGKSTIAIYYITDFHERIKEAFTRAKVTMVERPSEDLPQDVGVRNAAVNRVAFLLRRHYYLTKLRALLLQQLDTEELRQEAIAKSLPRHHD